MPVTAWVKWLLVAPCVKWLLVVALVKWLHMSACVKWLPLLLWLVLACGFLGRKAV